MLSGMDKHQLTDKHLTGDLFPLCHSWVETAEGGFSDHAADTGGTTNFGISLGFLKLIPTLEGDIDQDGDVDRDDIIKLTRERAAEFYRDYFWDAYQCDRMSFIPAICLFDSVINHRPRVAIRLFQYSIGAKADGVVGNKTVQAANSITDMGEFLADHLRRRRAFYHDIVNANSTQKVFLRGWLNRMDKLEDYILEAVE